MSVKADLIAKKVAIGVLFDTVTIELICGDEYAARVLYDDLIERMQSGAGVTLTAQPARPSTTET